MLVAAVANDLDFFYALYMHPQVNPYLLYEMMDKENFVPIFNELLQQKVLYKYVTNDGEVGMCKLILLKHRNSHLMYLGGLAIHPSQAGKGYGQKIMQDIIVFAKANHILRIELSTSVENEKAIALYKKIGFTNEGILKKYTHLKSESRFIDEVLMSYIF